MQNATTKAIIFDFNDTLSPSNFVQTFKRYENLLGMSVDEFVRAYIDNGLLRDLMVGRFSSENEFWREVSQLTGVNFDLLTRMAEDVALSKCLDTEVMQLIDELRNRYKLALLTDNFLETFNFWVGKFSLKSKFDVIANSADFGMLKSEPEIYLLLLRILNAKAQEVLMVDDDSRNLSVAESIGIRTLRFVGARQLEDRLIREGLLSRRVLRVDG